MPDPNSPYDAIDADDVALPALSEADRAASIRHAALHHAVTVVGARNPDAAMVLEAAKQFEAYLKGEGSPEQA